MKEEKEAAALTGRCMAAESIWLSGTIPLHGHVSPLLASLGEERSVSLYPM